MSPLRTTLPAAIVLATVAVYGQTIHFDFVRYDDYRYVLENRWLADGLTLDFLRFSTSFSPAAIHQGVSNWHPLTWLSYGLDVSLFGVNPGAMHGVNVAIHVVNALLVFALFDRTTRSPIASACIAGLFALHPLHVEAVAWIAERKELLAALFGLLACHAWVGFATRGGRLRYCAALACAALSLLAKPMWVTLPFLLLALDHWPLRRQMTDVRRLLLEKVPFLALSIVSALITLRVQEGALDAASAVPLWGRLLNAVVAPIRYLVLTARPVELSVIYPHPYLPGGKPPSTLEWLGVGLAWLALATMVWRARDRGYVVMGVAWFLVALGPVIGIVQVGVQAVADRYTYVPLLGIFAALTFGLADFLERRDRVVKGLAWVVAAAGFVLLGVRCADQVGAWRDTITLYERSLEATPDSAMLQYNLGNRYLDRGREREAILHLEAAHRLRPEWSAPTTNLAWLLATTDDASIADPARAVALALETTDDDGDDANALDTLAAAYAAAGDHESAERVASRAVRLARSGRKLASARVFEARRRLYAAGQRYVESTRPEEPRPGHPKP